MEIKTSNETFNKARDWFNQSLNIMVGKGPTKYMQAHSPRILQVKKIDRFMVGRVIMYFYDPKHKKTLPYFDRFPMCIPLRMLPDGFIGLNLHYLPIPLRQKLLARLIGYNNKTTMSPQTIANQEKYGSKRYEEQMKGLDERVPLMISTKDKQVWAEMAKIDKIGIYKPCIKRYLYSHVRSKFFQVDPADWGMVIAMPWERFEKASTTRVWNESKRQIGM